jgi:hypothetical protein
MTLMEQRPFLRSQERKILFADQRKEKKEGGILPWVNKQQ